MQRERPACSDAHTYPRSASGSSHSKLPLSLTLSLLTTLSTLTYTCATSTCPHVHVHVHRACTCTHAHMCMCHVRARETKVRASSLERERASGESVRCAQSAERSRLRLSRAFSCIYLEIREPARHRTVRLYTSALQILMNLPRFDTPI
jgi:hypothetical protein